MPVIQQQGSLCILITVRNNAYSTPTNGLYLQEIWLFPSRHTAFPLSMPAKPHSQFGEGYVLTYLVLTIRRDSNLKNLPHIYK